MRKILKIAQVLIIIAGLSIGVSQQAQQVITQQEPILQIMPPGQSLYISLIAKGLKYSFWDIVRLGAERAASDYGVEITLEGTEEERQVEEQLAILEAAIDRNPAAIVLSAVDSRAATPFLERANLLGIPVIGFDSGVVSPIVRTTVATDNYSAAALAGNKLAELLNGVGKVAIIIQDETSRVGIDRRDGFIDTITQAYPGIEVVAIRYGGGDVSLSAELTKEIIREHPDIVGIFGANEGSAHGVIKGVEELDKEGEIVIIGFDSGEVLIDAIREGVAAGAVTQNPIGIGYRAVEAALRSIRGERLPAFIDTGFAWYDRTNIDTPQIQELIYR